MLQFVGGDLLDCILCALLVVPASIYQRKFARPDLLSDLVLLLGSFTSVEAQVLHPLDQQSLVLEENSLFGVNAVRVTDLHSVTIFFLIAVTILTYDCELHPAYQERIDKDLENFREGIPPSML